MTSLIAYWLAELMLPQLPTVQVGEISSHVVDAGVFPAHEATSRNSPKVADPAQLCEPPQAQVQVNGAPIALV
jgi:hypothetical protein